MKLNVPQNCPNLMRLNYILCRLTLAGTFRTFLSFPEHRICVKVAEKTEYIRHQQAPTHEQEGCFYTTSVCFSHTAVYRSLFLPLSSQCAFFFLPLLAWLTAQCSPWDVRVSRRTCSQAITPCCSTFSWGTYFFCLYLFNIQSNKHILAACLKLV